MCPQGKCCFPFLRLTKLDEFQSIFHEMLRSRLAGIVGMLHPILPLKIEQVQVRVRIPPEYAARVYGSVKGYGNIRNEEWRADGSWLSIIEMPAGLYGPFLDRLGELTKGNAEAKKL